MFHLVRVIYRSSLGLKIDRSFLYFPPTDNTISYPDPALLAARLVRAALGRAKGRGILLTQFPCLHNLFYFPYDVKYPHSPRSAESIRPKLGRPE